MWNPQKKKHKKTNKPATTEFIDTENRGSGLGMDEIGEGGRWSKRTNFQL